MDRRPALILISKKSNPVRCDEKSESSPASYKARSRTLFLVFVSYYFLSGTTGPPGELGPRGLTGERGERGERGQKGNTPY